MSTQNLNRVPAGLLSLFQIKSLGQNPNTFEDSVRPVFELADFYLTDIGLKIENASQAGVDQGDQGTAIAPILVPDDEIWLIRGLSAEQQVTTFAANEAMGFLPAIDQVPGGSATGFRFGNHSSRASVGNMQLSQACIWPETVSFDRPLLLPGGSRIYSDLSYIASAAVNLQVTVTTRVLYYPIEK